MKKIRQEEKLHWKHKLLVGSISFLFFAYAFAYMNKDYKSTNTPDKITAAAMVNYAQQMGLSADRAIVMGVDAGSISLKLLKELDLIARYEEGTQLFINVHGESKSVTLTGDYIQQSSCDSIEHRGTFGNFEYSHCSAGKLVYFL
jgi:hypothetical protein